MHATDALLLASNISSSIGQASCGLHTSFWRVIELARLKLIPVSLLTCTTFLPLVLEMKGHLEQQYSSDANRPEREAHQETRIKGSQGRLDGSLY